ncbi:MAG: hypothetical protein SV201_14645, partial [Pseudomonadota bacterium]|nr:hypothetical protein [Pseudomonadota bacterium]
KQVCDDMAALGFKHKEYFEAAKVQREYADKYQAVIDALKAHKEEPGYIAAVRDIVDYMRRFDSDAETIEQQFS